jgi:hypothetical protein
MLTRQAVEKVGAFATHTRSAADYHFLCRVARVFPVNMIAVPCATKHDRAPAGATLEQGHLASGRASYRFEANKLGFFDEIYMRSGHGDETEILRRHNCFAAARAAVRAGLRSEAIRHLQEAAAPRRSLWRAYPALAYAKLMPSASGLKFGLRVAEAAERRLRAILAPGPG